MRTISLTAMQAILKEQVTQVFLRIIKVEHPDLGTPIKLVADKLDLTRGDGTYTAFPFDIELPPDDEENVGTVSLLIPLLDQALVETIRETDEPFTVTLSIVRAAAPDTVEVGPFVFEALGVDFDGIQCTVALAVNRNIMEDAFPKDIISPSSRINIQ